MPWVMLVRKATASLYNSVNPFCLWFHRSEQMKLHLESECSLYVSQKATARYLTFRYNLAPMFSINSNLFLLQCSHSAITMVIHGHADQALQIPQSSHCFFLYPFIWLDFRLSYWCPFMKQSRETAVFMLRENC